MITNYDVRFSVRDGSVSLHLLIPQYVYLTFMTMFRLISVHVHKCVHCLILNVFPSHMFKCNWTHDLFTCSSLAILDMLIWCGLFYCHPIPVEMPCRDPAVLWPRRSESELLKAKAQQGRVDRHDMCELINIGRLSTACGRPVQIRLLPATTRTFTKVV